MTLLIELSLFPFIVCFKLKGFDNIKLSFNKHKLRKGEGKGKKKGERKGIGKEVEVREGARKENGEIVRGIEKKRERGFEKGMRI